MEEKPRLPILREQDDKSVRIVVRPNRSLSAHGMFLIVAGFAAFSLTIGLGFALVGAWLILPFAGIEVMVLTGVAYWMYRHADDCELIVVDEASVKVTRRVGGYEERIEFQRYWARVRLSSRSDGKYPSQVLLGSHGRFVELGAAVLEADRQRLARVLREALAHRAAIT